MNRVCLVGRLTRDTELRATPSGVYTTSNTVAVKRDFKNAEGNYEADFINIVAWKGTAEYLCNYANKGSLVSIVGKIQTRNYDNQQGQKVYVTEVVAENVAILDAKKAENAPTEKQDAPMQPEYNDPFAEYGEQIDIDDSFLD